MFEFIPLPERSSAITANAYLDNVLARFGASAETLTDQGPEFMGEFQILLAQHSITHRMASREHPQSDGLAERMVQTMKSGL